MSRIGADVLVPYHYEGWSYFPEGREELEWVLRDEGVDGRVRWCKMGVETSWIRVGGLEMYHDGGTRQAVESGRKS